MGDDRKDAWGLLGGLRTNGPSEEPRVTIQNVWAWSVRRTARLALLLLAVAAAAWVGHRIRGEAGAWIGGGGTALAILGWSFVAGITRRG